LAMLRGDGWVVNHKRMERIWRQEGLKIPQKQPKRSRLWHGKPNLLHGAVVREAGDGQTAAFVLRYP
jgi:hypothetical protein